MDVFLSWSSERSRLIGKIFNEWLSNVFPTLDIYYSPEKIEAGQKWRESVGEGLKDNYIGLFFLVEENITSEWINFEAGAISNTVGEARVIPVLHDLKPEQISGPLAQFQAQKISKDGLKAIVRVINNSLDSVRKIEPERLNIVFEKWYPDFELEYGKFIEENPKIKKDNRETEGTGVLDEHGQIGEILNAVRRLERKMGNYENTKGSIELVKVGKINTTNSLKKASDDSGVKIINSSATIPLKSSNSALKTFGNHDNEIEIDLNKINKNE